MNVVPQFRICDLYDKYGHLLWEDNKHGQNAGAFLHEIEDITQRQGVDFRQNAAVDTLITELRRKGNSNATINRKLAAYYKLLRKAERDGLIMKLPAYVRLPEKKGRVRFLTIEEEARLFAALKTRSEQCFHLCEFLVDTGARVGEALSLKHADVDDNAATFWITKSGRSRTVPLTRRARAAVERYAANPIGPFSNIQYQKLRYHWHEVKKSCSLEGDKELVLHTLRHTCATRLVKAGIDLRRVQMFLGHQTIQMTLRYAHLATKDLDQCAMALERQLENAETGREAVLESA
ncbi:MAG: site-specific integrase [Pseudomonadota bacterium]